MRRVVLLFLAVALVAVSAWPQVGELTTWTLPGEDSFPGDLQRMVDNRLYVTIQNPRAIALLDPSVGTLTAWEMTEGPDSLQITNEGIVFTVPRAGQIGWLQPDFGHVEFFDVPSPWVEPSFLIDGGAGAGVVNLWYAAWTSGGIGVFEPSELTLPAASNIEPSTYFVSPATVSVTPSSEIVLPTYYPTNPYGNTFLTYEQAPTGQPPFREWQPFTGETYIFGLARDPDGRIWSTGLENDYVHVLTPWENEFMYYTLPETMVVYGLAPDAAKGMWFIALTDNESKLGRIDIGTGDVALWTMPAGTDPVGLTVAASEAETTIWFGDRGRSAIHRFDPVTNTFTWWKTGGDDSPLFLEPGYPGEVWATFELSGKIARLRLTAD